MLASSPPPRSHDPVGPCEARRSFCARMPRTLRWHSQRGGVQIQAVLVGADDGVHEHGQRERGVDLGGAERSRRTPSGGFLRGAAVLFASVVHRRIFQVVRECPSSAAFCWIRRPDAARCHVPCQGALAASGWFRRERGLSRGPVGVRRASLTPCRVSLRPPQPGPALVLRTAMRGKARWSVKQCCHLWRCHTG